MLVPLALWSRVAEPHWVAPAMLALGPAIARAPAAAVAAARRRGRRAWRPSCVAAVHAWVLVPQALRLAPASYDARLDLANELYGWPEVLRVVREEVAAQASPGLEDVSVVGPHWVVCAQLDADLRGDVHVGCNTPIPDDFDGWWPRDRWRTADSIVWVTDDRFGPPRASRATRSRRSAGSASSAPDRVVRTFTISVFTRRAEG